MKAFTLALVVVMAACAQVTVAPLFPLASAVPDFALLALVASAVFAGPRPAMAMLPALALAVGFLTGRSPALLIVAYLPLLPAGRWLETSGLPLSAYARLAILTAAGGAFARTILAAGAFANGADFAPAILLRDFIFPGIVLDAALLSAVYVPARLLGVRAGTLSLQRGGYL
jgi:hypothetical protein